MLLHIIKVTQSTVIFIARLFKDLLIVVETGADPGFFAEGVRIFDTRPDPGSRRNSALSKNVTCQMKKESW